jgi:hypothetical protein
MIESVVKELAFTAFVLTSLFVGTIRLPASVCPVSSGIIGKSCHGCCANKGCCADLQNNHSLPSQPLAKSGDANHEFVAIANVGLTTASFSLPLFAVSLSSSAIHIVGSTPRAAFLCTFLI